MACRPMPVVPWNLVVYVLGRKITELYHVAHFVLVGVFGDGFRHMHFKERRLWESLCSHHARPR
jgi:hypothetical protein